MSISEKAVEAAVNQVLSGGEFPIYRTQDDNGLERDEYVQFVSAVLAALPLQEHPDVAAAAEAIRCAGMTPEPDGCLSEVICHSHPCRCAQRMARAALAAAPPAPVQEDRWQPIETAPLDGTAIWLLVDGRPYLGYGEPTNWLYKTDQWFVKATFRRRDDETRHRDGLADEIYCCHGIDIAATHWQPLPIPPALIAEKHSPEK